MKIGRSVVWLLELAVLWLSASPARAQSIFDLSNGAPDVLYTRSSVLGAVDHTWRPLSVPAAAPKTAPFEFPKNLGVNESERVPTNSLGSGSVQPVEQPPSDRNVHWKPMLMESLLYTGIMHSFDVITEALVPALRPVGE